MTELLYNTVNIFKVIFQLSVIKEVISFTCTFRLDHWVNLSSRHSSRIFNVYNGGHIFGTVHYLLLKHNI